jgi:nitrate/nitrite-specific signal transduction histidine kinase
MNRYAAYFLLLFLWPALKHPLAAQSSGNRYNFKHLNVQNGLAQNIVYHFLQDKRGYMWVGTKHAQAGHVNLTIVANHHLNIKIQDDGIGFDVNNIRQYSNGLTNIEKRMKDIRGTVKIKNTNGTIMELIAPLPL